MFNASNPSPEKQHSSQSNTIIIITCVCFLLTLFIYRPFGLYFLNDDLIHIPWSGKGVFLQQGFLRCAHNVLSFIEINLFGKSATWFHAISLLLHLICSYLLYVLCKLIFATYSNLSQNIIHSAALLATSFFMLYAFHSESILWIIGSVSSMATVFFLLSFICYFKKDKNIFYFVLSMLFFLIALLTYENVWVMPMLIWIFWLADSKKNNNYKGWIYPTIVALVFLVHLYFRVKLIGQLASNYETKNVSHFNLMKLFLNYNRLLARSLLPPMQSVTVFMAAYAIAILLILWQLIMAFKRNQLNVLTLILITCLLVSFLPVISLGIDTHGTGAERYLYLPSVFLCMLMAYLLIIWQVAWIKKLIVIVMVLCFNGFYALKSSGDYHMASQLSKKILMEAHNNMVVNKKYEIYGLPSMLNRVKVLDIGFKEGMAWLYNMDTSNIKEMDKLEATTKRYETKPINFKMLLINNLDTVSQLKVLLDMDKVYLKPYLHADD